MKTYSSNNSNNPTPLPPEVKEALDREPAKLNRELERVWDLTGIALESNAPNSSSEMDDMWARIRSSALDDQRLRSMDTESRKRRVDRPPTQQEVSRRPTKRTAWYAFAFCMAALAGYVTYWVTPVTVEANRGQLAETVLPDGSQVTLNSGSSISYQRGFDGIPFVEATTRSVKLNGEAYFDVAHSSTPFSVETFNSRTAVLGTEFNIRAWPDEMERESRITLVSGIVAVSAMGEQGNAVQLTEPGETIVVRSSTDTSIDEMVGELEPILSWRELGLAISSKTLDAVFGELERRYDIEITVEDDDSEILEDSLTLLMSKPKGVESILSDICVEKNLKFRKTSRGYVIYRSAS